jgi:hypothetical protein
MSLKSVSRALSRVLATTTLVALSLPALAQDESGPNLGPDAEGAAPGGASTMSLAQELYAMGLSQGDAVTVLAAAKMAASVDAVTAEPAALDPATMTFDEGETTFRKKAAPAAVPAAPAPMGTDGTPRAVAKASFFNATSEEDGAADAPVSADAMFARSKELTAGDDALLAVIESAMAEGPRDRIGGAVSWPSRLAAGTTDVWEVPFYGNLRAEIAVIGDGDANLDVVVTDETGNVICGDVSWSDSLYCDFTPARDGYFYVTVENLGRARNSYHLMTN